MKLTITTTTLQEMVGKSVHCVSNNKLIPLTSLISIKVEKGVLTLSTTDATNYFYVSSKAEFDCEDFEVSVFADTFVKLIQKTTSDEVTLTVDLQAKVLTIKGNGTYKMELPLDEKGKPIKFPKKFVPDDLVKEDSTIKVSTIKSIILSNKSSLATDMQIPVLTAYYCGDKVVTSNKKTVCWCEMPTFSEPILISPIVMDLLSSMSGENIDVYKFSGEVSGTVFQTDVDVVYAPEFEGVDVFPVDKIGQLVNQELNSKCVVSRKAVLDVLDRLGLFVGSYDKKSIRISFTQEGLMLSSKKSSGVEVIPFVSSENFAEFSASINIEFLQAQVSAQTSETVEISYGSPLAIKLVTDNIIQIIALLKEDELK